MRAPTTAQRRFERVASDPANADLYRQYVQQLTGHTVENTEALIRVIHHVRDGGNLQPRHIQLIKDSHPGVAPAYIDSAVAWLGAQPPGPRRADALQGLLSGDQAFLSTADYSQRSENTLKLDRLQRDYAVFDASAAIEARSAARVDRTKPDIALDQHRAKGDGALDVRSLVSRQLEPKGKQAFMEALDGGSEVAESIAKERLATRIEDAHERLGSAESVRDSVAAAFDAHGAEAAGVDRGWLPDTNED